MEDHIKKVFPNYNEDETRKLIEDLENVGVDSVEDLKNLVVEDDLKAFMKPIHARKLLGFKKSKHFFFCFLKKPILKAIFNL